MLRVVGRECSKRSYRCTTPASKSTLRMLATEGGSGRLVELKTKDEYINFPREKSALYFTAKWCPPCRRIGPFFTELSEETPSVSFGKVDIDDNPDAAKMSEIMSVPTFKFFEGGQEVNQVVGADADAVEQAVAKLAEG